MITKEETIEILKTCKDELDNMTDEQFKERLTKAEDLVLAHPTT